MTTIAINQLSRPVLSPLPCSALIRSAPASATRAPDHVRTMQALADANLIVENSPTVLFRMSVGKMRRIIFLSKNVSRYGYEAEEFISGARSWESIVVPEDLQRILVEGQAHIAAGHERFMQQYRVVAGDGAIRWVEVQNTPFRDAAGKFIGYQGVVNEITERKEAEQRILELAQFDSLTGLANRRLFKERLTHELTRCARGQTACAVHLVDLDHFKDINDTLGHAVGDALLRAVADRLKHQVRGGDTIARLGGDEFAVLQTDAQDATTATLLAQKLVDELAQPFAVEGHQIHVSASVGAAVSASDHESEVLVRNADMALYQVKEDGRNGYRLHTDRMSDELTERVSIAADLRRALERNELFLEYQPQVDGRTGALVGLEALVRWHHPERGVLPPGVFIPVAELSGQIVELDRWVLRAALKQAQAWRSADLAVPRIAVNVSALQFKAHGFEATIDAALTESGCCGSQLEIEITESVLMSASERHDHLLQRLRDKGISIAIDDFGTGYSSFASLSQLRPHRLKIPHQFVSRMLTERSNRAIVDAIVGMANAIGIDVVAEAVEHPAQVQSLLRKGCIVMQGSHLGRPQTAAGISMLLHPTAASPRHASRSGADRLQAA
jgi:diguanylate cyclase (GGDEF)-like protein/PAS domain S-box-containing protein